MLRKKGLLLVLTGLCLLLPVQQVFAAPGQSSMMLDNESFKSVSWVISGLAGVFALISAIMLLRTLVEIVNKIRTFEARGTEGVKSFFSSLGVVLALITAVYFIPTVFMKGVTWSEIQSSSPSIIMALWSVIGAISVFYLYYLLNRFFVKPDDRSLFSIITFSVLSGGSYAMVMFIVNTGLQSEELSKGSLGGYFVLGLILYVFGQKLVRVRLTELTNSMLFRTRVDLINKILKTPFYKMESIGKEKVYTSLNNDTETISAAIGLIVIGATSSVTILTSFIYLGASDIFALLMSIVLVIIAGALLVLVNKSADKLFNQVRDSQNTFFSFIDDLVGGFKELYMNKQRRREFREDMVESCEEYRVKRVRAELVTANVYFVGELLAFIVLGGLVFLLPVLFAGVKNTTLSDYVLVFLFLKGPLDNVINMIPRITQVRVSWRRIREISDQIAHLQSSELEEQTVQDEPLHIELRNVEFSYRNDANEKFSVGPINCDFASGEIVFITGGNGSGKSTLAKLITGLYAPESGQIVINDRTVETEGLGQYFSTVFTDYYLFNKLYGIEHAGAAQTIQKYLNTLGIADKVQIDEGKFSTTKLSTGQKKRLALLISYLEDRPVLLFDEWAADQDPAFRSYFYQELLPEMKARGKCVIAITHDDRYFGLADKVIKMESGQVVQEQVVAG